MSMSEFERRRRRAALEKSSTVQSESDQKNQEDETKIISDWQKEALQRAAKLTGRFAKTVAAAAKTGLDQAQQKAQALNEDRAKNRLEQEEEKRIQDAVLVQEQAQHVNENADAWRQELDAKRSEREEAKVIQEEREEHEPEIEGSAATNPKSLSKHTVMILASAAVLAALSGAGAWFWTHHESKEAPEQHQVTTKPQPSMPAPDVHEAPKAPELVQVVEPVQDEPKTPLVEVQPKAVEPEPQKVEKPTPPKAVVRVPKKKSESPKKIEAPNPSRSDWVDKANNDLDKFADQLK